MKRSAWTTLLALGFAASSHAAGFNCERATTAMEKMICADPGLSNLDDQLNRTYSILLARSAAPEALAAEQAHWLTARRNACRTSECANAAYLDRLDELAAADYADLSSAINATCTDLFADAIRNPDTCRVTQSAAFGSIGKETFHFAIYCLRETSADNTPCIENGIALFSTNAGAPRARRWHMRGNDAGDIFSTPTIYKSATGSILEMSVRVDGSGNFNDSDYFLRQGSRWAAIDAVSWGKDLGRRIPKGVEIWKGIWPDLRHMTARAALYHHNDANCCPTAGTALIELTLIGTRLAIKSMKTVPERMD